MMSCAVYPPEFHSLCAHVGTSLHHILSSIAFHTQRDTLTFGAIVRDDGWGKPSLKKKPPSHVDRVAAISFTRKTNFSLTRIPEKKQTKIMSENEPKQLTAEELAAKEAKKAAKKAAKLAKQQEKERKKQERLEAESKANEVPLVATPDAANYGLLKLNNSAYKTDRKFIEIGTVGEELVGQSVWVRGRVHNIRDKGNSVFIVFRRGVYTIQGSLFKSEKIPKAFVKFAAKIPAESIVDIKGIVAKLPEVSTTTTQSTVEISIEKLLIVSASAPLPFQIEDASRPVNENDVR